MLELRLQEWLKSRSEPEFLVKALKAPVDVKVTNSIVDQIQRSLIMGVLNVTPDSFSDGGKFESLDSAIKHAQTLVEEGADILDVGGESTRPGASEVSVQEELDRVIPIIETIKKELDVAVSVDTSKHQVMSAAVGAGADMINDVTALSDVNARQVVAESGLPVCLMHMQGKPRQMQENPSYSNVVADVKEYLQNVANLCEQSGIAHENIILDPGIGFGKTLEHNLRLLAAVPEIRAFGYPVLIGVSRKSMIEHMLKRSVDQRLSASLGLAVQAVLNGADIVRVHDVRETHDAIRAVEAVANVNMSA